MGLVLAHGSFDWVMSGCIVFVGLMVYLVKIIRGHILSVIIGGFVWYFVYSIHSGSTAGIMTATLAALLFDTIGLPLLKLFRRRGDD